MSRRDSHNRSTKKRKDSTKSRIKKRSTKRLTTTATNTSKSRRKKSRKYLTMAQTEDSPTPYNSSFMAQLWILFWKSCITRRVHFISTFFEIIGPVALLLFCAQLNSKLYPVSGGVSNGNLENIQQPFQNDSLGPIIYKEPLLNIHFDYKDGLFYEIYYAPNDPSFSSLFDRFVENGCTVIGVNNRSSLLDKVKFDPNISKIGVYFEQVDKRLGQFAYELIIQSETDKTFIDLKNPFPYKSNQMPTAETSLIYMTFSKISSYLNLKFAEDFCSAQRVFNCQLKKKIEIRKMPYPVYKNPSKINALSIHEFLGMFLTIGYVLVCPLIVKRITDEKSTKVKELLSMIGMSDTVFWLSHFINFYIIIIFHALLSVPILFYYGPSPLIQHTTISMVIFIYLVYGVQLVMFSMLITTVFNRPVLAVIMTCILWITASSLTMRFLSPSLNQLNSVENVNFWRFVTSMLPTGSFFWFMSIIGHLEVQNSGLNWTDFAMPTSLYSDFTALSITLAIILSIVFYIILIWYLENVWPFQYGVPKSPIFFLYPSYWCPKEATKHHTRPPRLSIDMFEPDPVDLSPTIEIQNTSKVFSSFGMNKKVAVDQLWLNIYKNQLTVLLGHNGAGKSTLMNMITGMFPSSFGQIYINSYNVITNTKQARQSIGLCPQENIYFNELTVAQHLKLFAVLKNYPYSLADDEVDETLQLLQLVDKKDVRAGDLSGGMKRKLALGIAYVGKTNVLILDEPTSGMDPEARRVIWDFLISIRRRRTILLTTHYMEEADVLADRIAIMNHGKLCCSGSSLFLKNAFGTGYQLRIEKHSGFKSSKFLALLQHYIPTASLRSEIETEVIYCFNQKANDKGFLMKLPSLFNDIETNKQAYHINSVGMSYSTLEDVFIFVGSDMKTNPTETGESTSVDSSFNKSSVSCLAKKNDLVQGFNLHFNQLVALIVKRYHFALRFWPMLIFQLIIPSLIIMFAMYLDSKIRSDNLTTELKVDLNVKNLYNDHTKTFYSGPPELFKSYSDVNTQEYNALVTSVNIGSPIDSWILTNVNTMKEYIEKHIYGLQVYNNQYIPWFNNEQTHSLPLSINVLFETLLRLSSQPDISTNVFIRPSLTTFLAKKNAGKESEENNQIVVVIVSWVMTSIIFLPIAFPFLAASYVLFPIQERCSKMKLLQLMTGLSPALYWISNFIFDLLFHTLAIFIMCIIIFFYDTDNVFFGDSFSASGLFLCVILFAFGIGVIPQVYALSYLFSSPSTGFVYLVIIFLIFGFIGNLAMSIWDLMQNFFHVELTFLTSLLLPLRTMPIFSMLFGYQKLYKISSFAHICNSLDPKLLDSLCGLIDPNSSSLFRGCCPNQCGDMCYQNASPFTFTAYGSMSELFFLIFTGIFYLSIIIIYEMYWQKLSKLFQSIFNIFSKSNNFPPDDVNLYAEDSDVQMEREQIENLLEHDPNNIPHLLCVSQLTKTYGNFVAVNHLSFGVQYNECFGLLGINGAGKTTTFSMLTGDLLPTSGNAFIEKGKYALIGNLKEFQKNIGYCPQFDAVLEKLTGVETLSVLALLRGVPRRTLKQNINLLISMVGLEEHANNTIDTYSGGNRRKLSIAMALAGNPSILFLDEPTAGVDPVARRKIWETLGYIKSNYNCSIILTSHSMEECEALCTRIAIMVNGSFRCLGSTQHLRSKYGQGYSILIRLKRINDDVRYSEKVQENLVKRIPSAVLKDSHQCLMQFHVTDVKEKWSTIFTKMIELDNAFDFEDYVVSDTTLENIFIMFARNSRKKDD